MTGFADTTPDVVQAWQQVYLGAATAAPSTAACVCAAFRLADQVWRQVAADPILDTRTRTAVTGPENWARTALGAYHHLRDSGAYTHLDVAAPLRCWSDPPRLRTWLTGPNDLPGFAHTTLARSWGIDDDFAWDAEGIGTRMGTLIEQAQRAGVYGVPGYTITLRQVTTDDPDADQIVEHQVTLTNAAGAVFASTPLPADHLADDDLTGVDAALAVLSNTASIVNELLATEAHLVTTRITNPAPHPLPQPAAPSRGFGPLNLSSPTAPPALEAPPPRPSPHHSR